MKPPLDLHDRHRFPAETISHAVLERTRERVPLDWAATRNNLGTALETPGQLGDDDALRRAVAAYQAALDELWRHKAPAYISRIERNLARARGLLP
jgi:hypothetical protein